MTRARTRVHVCAPPSPGRPVYDDSEVVGWIRFSGRWGAFDMTGRLVSEHATEEGARRAILAAAAQRCMSS
jgi:hypothetical protein